MKTLTTSLLTGYTALALLIPAVLSANDYYDAAQKLRNEEIRMKAMMAVSEDNPCTKDIDAQIGALITAGIEAKAALRRELSDIDPAKREPALIARETIYLEKVEPLLSQRATLAASCARPPFSQAPQTKEEAAVCQNLHRTPEAKEKYPSLWAKNKCDTPVVSAPAAAPAGLPFDAEQGAWYAPALVEFIAGGFLSSAEPFRPGEQATREEFIRLIVEMRGGALSALPVDPSFDDVPADSPAFGWFEEAARSGWVTGQGNCYGRHPCYAKPHDPVNRAEAAALIIRAFGLVQGDAPAFEDAPAGAWYADIIRTAASRCILQGDEGGRRVRPAAHMNRAEMIVMLRRAGQGFAYPHCQ